MASVKFQKDSQEWHMFQDYWNLCQKYWIPESKDSENYNSWWKDYVIKEADEFVRKHNNHPFAAYLVVALMNYLEEKTKEIS